MNRTPDPKTISDAITETSGQIARVDIKASMLLAGALTSVSVSIALLAKTKLPAPVTAGALLTVALIAVAVAVLITAVRPTLGGNHGFMRWASTNSLGEVLSDFSQNDRENAAYLAQRLMALSRMVRHKYRLVQLATDLLRAALLIALLTASLFAII
ncbi:Pycsar system effector family protein [Actinoplanes sp. NBRC 103695]|uniref:Pycsar system effector family protein n=1 Tax=Actinoplanes sp. NBRC 103695 TaxID=3032202 RepID=UPI0024A36EA4|nr:Pycsar system effector family protein [Actinoplanes sp. NBRC 103695]GLZ00579.1 hypothetical protein Acsp02_78310 [Actinoplanes sp. NBRC 103695]